MALVRRFGPSPYPNFAAVGDGAAGALQAMLAFKQFEREEERQAALQDVLSNMGEGPAGMFAAAGELMRMGAWDEGSKLMSLATAHQHALTNLAVHEQRAADQVAAEEEPVSPRMFSRDGRVVGLHPQTMEVMGTYDFPADEQAESGDRFGTGAFAEYLRALQAQHGPDYFADPANMEKARRDWAAQGRAPARPGGRAGGPPFSPDEVELYTTDPGRMHFSLSQAQQRAFYRYLTDIGHPLAERARGSEPGAVRDAEKIEDAVMEAIEFDPGALGENLSRYVERIRPKLGCGDRARFDAALEIDRRFGAIIDPLCRGDGGQIPVTGGPQEVRPPMAQAPAPTGVQANPAGLPPVTFGGRPVNPTGLTAGAAAAVGQLAGAPVIDPGAEAIANAFGRPRG